MVFYMMVRLIWTLNQLKIFLKFLLIFLNLLNTFSVINRLCSSAAPSASAAKNRAYNSTGKAICDDCTCLLHPEAHLIFNLLWSAVLARQSIMVLLLSEEVPGCSCVSLAKRGCLKAIMSSSSRLLKLPDWRRTWQGQKSQLKTLEGCVWLLCSHDRMVDCILQTADWIHSNMHAI